MKFGLSDDDVAKIKRVLAACPAVKKVVVFGSRAMGNYKNGSDIDLAIWSDEHDNRSIGELKTALEEGLSLPYFFDLVEYSAIDNPQLRQHIDTYGIVLIER